MEILALPNYPNLNLADLSIGPHHYAEHHGCVDVNRPKNGERQFNYLINPLLHGQPQRLRCSGCQRWAGRRVHHLLSQSFLQVPVRLSDSGIRCRVAQGGGVEMLYSISHRRDLVVEQELRDWRLIKALMNEIGLP